jgi:hypothetical protein
MIQFRSTNLMKKAFKRITCEEAKKWSATLRGHVSRWHPKHIIVMLLLLNDKPIEATTLAAVQGIVSRWALKPARKYEPDSAVCPPEDPP